MTVAALITGTRTLEINEYADAPPAEGCVTVEIAFCGICGTEISSFRSGSVHHPSVCGHEWSGIVSAVGTGVTSLTEGDRVNVGVCPPCGQCVECRSGLTDFCATALTMARGRDARAPLHGAFARSLSVDAARVVLTPAGLSPAEAAQVEPAAVAIHGVRRSNLKLGDTVVVQGGGSIGLLALQFARVSGAGTAIVIEPNAERRELALTLGADVALAPGAEADAYVKDSTGGIGADVVFECVGAAALIQPAVALARRGGTMLLLGYSAEAATINPAHWLAKEINVVGAVSFTHDDVIRAMDLMASGRVRVAPLHSRTIGIGQLEATLTELADGGSGDLKVLVDPTL